MNGQNSARVRRKPLAFWQPGPTHVFFGEDPGEAQVAGHLGFEKSVLPQVGIQAVGSYSDLDAVQSQGGKRSLNWDRCHSTVLRLQMKLTRLELGAQL